MSVGHIVLGGFAVGLHAPQRSDKLALESDYK